MPVKISDDEFFYHTFEVHTYFTLHDLVTSALKHTEEESAKNTIKENLVSLFQYRLSKDPAFQQYILGKIADDAKLFQRTVRYINYLKEYATFDKEYCIFGSSTDAESIQNEESTELYCSRYVDAVPSEDDIKYNTYSLFHKILDTNILEKLTLSLESAVDESVNRLLRRIVYTSGNPYFSCNLIPFVLKLQKKNIDKFNSTITKWKTYFHKNITYKPESYLPLFTDLPETASESEQKDTRCGLLSKELIPASASVISYDCPLFYGISYIWDFRKKIANEFFMSKKEETQPFWKIEYDSSLERQREHCQKLKKNNYLTLMFNEFTTDFLSIAAELWFREKPESEQLLLLNTEYPYSLDAFLKDNLPVNIYENTADALYTQGYYAEAKEIYQHLAAIEDKQYKRKFKKYHYNMLLGECARLTLDYQNALEFYADAKKDAYSAINSGRWEYSSNHLDKPEFFELIADIHVREMTHTLGKSSFSIPVEKMEKLSGADKQQLTSLIGYSIPAAKRLGIYNTKQIQDGIEKIEKLAAEKESAEVSRAKGADTTPFIIDTDYNPVSDILPEIKRASDGYQNACALSAAETIYNTPKYIEKRCVWYDTSDTHTMYHQYKLSVMSHLTYAKLLVEIGDFVKAKDVLHQYEEMRISKGKEFLLAKFKECTDYERYRNQPDIEDELYASQIQPVIDADSDLGLTEYYLYDAVCRICLKQMTADDFRSSLDKQGITEKHDDVISYLITMGKILVPLSSKTDAEVLPFLESVVLAVYPGFEGEYIMTGFYVEFYWSEYAIEWFDRMLSSVNQQRMSAVLKLKCADFYLKCGESQKALEALRAVESTGESDVSEWEFWRKYAKAYEQNRDYANVKKCYLKIQQIASETNKTDAGYDEEIEKINEFLERNISLSNKFITTHPEISNHFLKAEYASIPFYQQHSATEKLNCVVPLIYYAWGYEAYLSASVWKYVRDFVRSCEIEAEQFNQLESWWIKPFSDIANEKAYFAPTLGNWANLSRDLECEAHENKVKGAMVSYLKENYDENILADIILVAKILYSFRNDICHAKPVYLTQNRFLRKHKKIVTKINQIIAFIDGVNERRGG